MKLSISHKQACDVIARGLETILKKPPVVTDVTRDYTRGGHLEITIEDSHVIRLPEGEKK